MERQFTIEASHIYQDDYQMKMLRLNEIEGVVPVRGIGINGKSHYIYQVSGKISVQAMYSRGKVTGDDIDTLLRSLLTTMESLESHLLDINCLLLSEEYIFFTEEYFCFCYYPLPEQDIYTKFHEFSDFLVKHADYDEELCSQKVFYLYQESGHENYDLNQLLRNCLAIKSGKEQQEKDVFLSTDDYITHDSDPDGLVAEEMDVMGEKVSPLRKLFRRRKKAKWGDFDGMPAEEEYLK